METSSDIRLDDTPAVETLGRIFVDPVAHADPISWHAAAARIRAESPILRVEVQGFPKFWAITTYADVMEIERNPEIFTNAPIPVLAASRDAAPAGDVPVKTLIQMDGDVHKSHRNLVNDWFKPGQVKRLQDRVDELSRDSIDSMAGMGGQCDFMNDVAVHFPLQVIMAILGLPEEDYPRMLQLTQELFGAEDPDIARVGTDEGMLQVVSDFITYFRALTADRRAHPSGDLASVIANGHIDGTALSDMDTFGYYLIIATAGHDTTSNVIGGALLALVEHRDQLQLLQEQPGLVSGAADEFIRFVSPVRHFLRTCQEPFTLRDVTFQPGDLVMLSFASANRDESVFVDPDRLDVQRTSGGGLAFGFGRHFCLGAHLARMEIRSFFGELLRRVEHVELAGEPTWIRANFVQGPKSIPISYHLR